MTKQEEIRQMKRIVYLHIYYVKEISLLFCSTNVMDATHMIA